MGLIDRTLAAARQLLAVNAPAATPTADVVSDANTLASGSRSLLGDLWYATSALYNAVTGVGTQRDSSRFNEWAVPRPLRRGELYGMGRNALILQALSKLPNTAMREGWRTIITEPDVEDTGDLSDQIAAYEQRLGIANKSARAMVRGRQYGEAMVLLGVDDGRPMSEPVDINNIRTIRWAAVIDVRYYQPHELYQADSPNFGTVKLFSITDINGVLEDGLRTGPNSLSFTSQVLTAERNQQGGQLLVHESRVLHFPTADYLPLLDTLQDSFGAFFEAMHGIRTGARESSTVVYSVNKWLRKTWSENAPLAQQHMAFVDRAKSSMNAWVIDPENEGVDIKSRSLGGLADLANPFMVWLSAALATPVTVLWGVSPGGFGKGEAERETWHEEARTYFYAVAVPQLRKVDTFIIAAQDGCQLPATTQFTIEINDLSPPDEEIRSNLRQAALVDLTTVFEKGGITRDEYRDALTALNDDYFRITLTKEGERVTKDALVGAITGTVAILQAAGKGEIPPESAEIALARLIPSSFDEDAAAKIMAPIIARQRPSTPVTAPGDIEDDEATTEQPSEVDIAWSQSPLPEDHMEASAIAAELGGIPTGRITRAHKAGLVEAWNVLGGKPRYSLSEVRRVVLEGNGKLPARVTDARERDDYELAIMLRAPDDVARWVPYKAKDSSAPHITLLHVGDVPPARMLSIIDAVRRVLAQAPALDIAFDGVGYFDKTNKRVAFMRVRPTAALTELHHALRRAIVDCGVELEHPDRGFVPRLTLAYLEPGEDYEGPVPPTGWTACSAEIWYDSLALPIPCAEQFASDAGVTATRDPFPNEHAARQRDPNDFVQSTFRRKQITRGVSALFGKLKSDPRGGMVVQTYRFDADVFTPAQARKWLADNNTDRRALEVASRDSDTFTFGDGYALEHDRFDTHAWLSACDALSEEAKAERIAEAFRKYHETVNMGAAELREWSQTEWSKQASVNRTPIDRNLRLLETPREDWTLAHAASALRTVGFVSRMRGMPKGAPLKIDGREGPSKRDISLKNWAFDPRK